MDEKRIFDCQQAIDEIRKRFAFDFVSLSVENVGEDLRVIRWQYASGNVNDRYKRIVLYSGKGIAGIVYKTGKPMLIVDVEKEVPAGDRISYPILNAERLKSVGAIPLWKNKRVAGVLLIGSRHASGVSEKGFEELQSYLSSGFGPFQTKEL
ncbi:GAF domain-containing protein [Bacillus sp. 1P06AnD]|uniref:GAF domain-containing protein n=1 Tax=Bacillus sp. 1P06AnD TaxID=3132208 RepID=UPI0039A0A9A4